MTKKTTAPAEAAPEAEQVQAPEVAEAAADAPDETLQTSAATEPQPDAPEPEPAAPQSDVSGRALVDIPEHGLMCGEYGSVSAEAASGLVSSGRFDPKAVQPQEQD